MADSYHIAPLHRRLIAMIYDFLLAGTFISVISSIASALLVWQEVTVEPNTALSNAFFSIQLLLGFIYLAFFWLRSGKTPGAWVWKIQNLSQEGRVITLIQAAIRYIVLLLILCGSFIIAYKGLNMSIMQSITMMFVGFAFIIIWSRFNKAGLMLHEDMSRTIGIDLR
ncbi:MAG: Unknown protein [uncultured Thiotrichaceae bacterium]|uniref:RDD domain-containing protein n=1 Tax=uncultured Thiotrichaceae bacterium TaxID=298394 RepID=A0A6S6TZP0_9GAMM|nr:MAG: Unknown protein [uncultured Thiotrichaceae bacterium]